MMIHDPRCPSRDHTSMNTCGYCNTLVLSDNDLEMRVLPTLDFVHDEMCGNPDVRDAHCYGCEVARATRDEGYDAGVAYVLRVINKRIAELTNPNRYSRSPMDDVLAAELTRLRNTITHPAATSVAS